MSDPWYQDGLRFECTRCGNCCTGAPGFVWVTPAEITQLAKLVGMPESQFRDLYTKVVGKRRTLREKLNNDCVFFERDKGCTVYSARPTQCRTWPFWESTTLTPEAWQHTQKGCPGAGHGKLFSAEEITQRVRKISV